MNSKNIMDKVADGIADSADERSRPVFEGLVVDIVNSYNDKGNHLLGYVLDLNYDKATIVTCDGWKLKCGGVPKNSFIIIKASQAARKLDGASVRPPILILGRVTQAVATPVSQDIQRTIFAIHKVQAVTDPYTSAELQWGALQISILGTYFDDGKEVKFGNDIDSYLSPHFYEVYVPQPEHLALLINSFVDGDDTMNIGRLRFTETELIAPKKSVDIQIAPKDFIANRTALFGKTRMGKSNTIKVILEMMLNSKQEVGQVVFDLSGEYTYPDKQTGGSIYLRHRSKCTRYSLNPREPEAEKLAGIRKPNVLRVNFYEQLSLGHSMISSLFNTVHATRPDYMAPFFGWEPIDELELNKRFAEDPFGSEKTRYQRAISMYKGLLRQAGFEPPERLQLQLHITSEIREELASLDALKDIVRRDRAKVDGELGKMSDTQDLDIALRVYEQLWGIFNNTSKAKLFPASKESGKPYFEPIHIALLKMIGDTGISGAKKLTPFKGYHDPKGSSIAEKIVKDVKDGKTVLIDLSQADQIVSTFYSEMIARAVLNEQMKGFAELETEVFEKQSALFYFEEAHNLFRADDKDLTSIYNKLAKEGAKFRVGMVYATQSMTTLSPDLLKNTENFFIAHLNDDREIREIERRYEFQDIGLDIQRSKTKGYVRMITLSHRYALPVQIRLFEHTDTTDKKVDV